VEEWDLKYLNTPYFQYPSYTLFNLIQLKISTCLPPHQNCVEVKFHAFLISVHWISAGFYLNRAENYLRFRTHRSPWKLNVTLQRVVTHPLHVQKVPGPILVRNTGYCDARFYGFCQSVHASSDSAFQTSWRLGQLSRYYEQMTRDWVHLIHRLLIGLLYQPRMTEEYGAFGGMRIWDRIRAAAVGNRRLTALAIARPIVTRLQGGWLRNRGLSPCREKAFLHNVRTWSGAHQNSFPMFTVAWSWPLTSIQCRG
jgi:hypothetical protein